MTMGSSPPVWCFGEKNSGVQFSSTRAVDSYMRLRGRAVMAQAADLPADPPLCRPPLYPPAEEPLMGDQANAGDADVLALSEPSTAAMPPDEAHTYIASTRLIQNTKLCGTMRREYAIRLEERDYGYLKPFTLDGSDPQEILEADLVIDFRTALVYHPILDLCQTQTLSTGGRSGLSALLRLLVRASIRYEVLWAVLDASACGRRDTLTPPVRAALSRLSALSAALGERLQLDVRVVVGFSVDELARFARRAGEMARKEVEGAAAKPGARGGWGTGMPWNSRDFLGPDGLHEHFLCSLGLSSFAAQTLLTLFPLRELLSLGRWPKDKSEDTDEVDRPTRDSLLGWIPDRVLNSLQSLTLTPFGSAGR